MTPPTAPSVRLPDAIAATLVTPAAYAGAEIHDAHRWLRAHQPLGRAEPEGYDLPPLRTRLPVAARSRR